MDSKIENGLRPIPRTVSRESLRSVLHLQVPTKETFLSSKVSLYVEELKPKIPDGGWGWIVVAGCFFINLAADGVGSTFGLLNIEFLNEFQASNSATSLIGSLFLSVPLLAGPLGSAMVDRYGCKYMTVVGSLICTLGLVLSAFVKNIWMMYLTFGIISGIGFCFCFITAVVSIAFWFEKRRTIALGIAASGTGLGTVIYSPLLTYLLKEYGWRGSILIMAALVANMCISGLLMRDPDWIVEEERKERERKKAKKRTELVSKKDFQIEDIKTCVITKKDHKFRHSLVELPTFLHENEKVPLEVLKKLSENKKLYNIILQNYPNLLSCKSVSETAFPLDKSLHDIDVDQLRVPVVFNMKLKDPNAKTANGIDDVDIKTPLLTNEQKKLKPQAQNQPNRHNYLKNIRLQKTNMGYRGAMLNIPRYKLASSSCPDLYINTTLLMKEEDEEWYDEYVDILKDLTHIGLFNYLHFLLLSLSTIIMCIWFVVPYFYLPVHMSLLGYTENQASFTLSVIGFTNIIGMVGLAILGDKFNAVKVYAVCLLCCGLTCGAMMMFSENYVLLLVSSAMFGLFISSCYSLQPSILADLVPLDNFTMAYGLSLLCQGIGNLAGPPIAGLLYDVTQSYAQSFYQAAFWVIISGVLIGIIPFTENRKIFK